MSFPKLFPWPRLLLEAPRGDAVPLVFGALLAPPDCEGAEAGVFTEDDSCNPIAEASRAASDVPVVVMLVMAALESLFARAGPDAIVVPGPAATVKALAAANANTPPLTTTARLRLTMLADSLRLGGYGWHKRTTHAAKHLS